MFSKQMNVKTRCPKCNTEYPLVPAVLKATRGVARCAQCAHVFNAFDHRVKSPAPTRSPPKTDVRATSYEPLIPPNTAAPEQTSSSVQPMYADDVTRPEPPATRSPWLVLLLILLCIALLAQIVWMKRATILGWPVAQPLCEWMDCRIAQKSAPESFQVVGREIRHDPFQQDVLHFSLRFRNDASFAQPLPLLLLHLFDGNEYLVARKHLAPHEYLPDTATAERKVQPREIIHVALTFMDPGAQASGFRIDFLPNSPP